MAGITASSDEMSVDGDSIAARTSIIYLMNVLASFIFISLLL
jgi:hypothetical protein